MSPSATLAVLEIGEFLTKVARVHGLVEQYAAAKSNPGMYEMPATRALQQLKLQFMGAGYDSLSQLCGSMEMALRRGGSQTTKSRILREAVASLRFQLELAQRTIKMEDQAVQQRKADAAAAEGDS
jgi:hypothetical protein